MPERDPHSFRARVRDGAVVIGTFVKSRGFEITEIVAGAAFDFAVLDAEHAPLGRADLDAQLLAARAGALPALVRVPNASPDTIGSALDMGACGVMVPHVCDAAAARAAVAATRYRSGVRGFSNSPRAGDYGAIGLGELMTRADAETALFCQIENREGVENVDAIAAVEGVDVLFIGRADLAVAYGATSLDDDAVSRTVDAILAAGRKRRVATGIFLPDASQVRRFRERGASVFVIGSDQSVLRAGLSKLCADARAAAG